jgi:hypothetical protein
MDYRDFTEAVLLVAHAAKDKLNTHAGVTSTELQTATLAALLRVLHVDRETELIDFLKAAESKRRLSKAEKSPGRDLVLTERSQSRLKQALGRSKSARRALKSTKEL